jgi:hypothetical protein
VLYCISGFPDDLLQENGERREAMTNVSATQEKLFIRSQLFRAAQQALEKDGWRVERIARSGKSSMRRITKGKLEKTVSIRTSQDTWIAFPRTSDDRNWATLADVDYVVAASVDSRDDPRFAQVHLIEGGEMRARFDRAYAARKKAGYTIARGRGIWLSLYEEESEDPVTLVGAGAGRDHPAIAKVPLSGQKSDLVFEEPGSQISEGTTSETPLTIAQAKRRLAQSLGVSEADIKITISG